MKLLQAFACPPELIRGVVQALHEVTAHRDVHG